MTMLNVMRRLLRRHAVFIGIATLVLAGIELIIPAVIATLNMPELIGGVLATLPPGIGLVVGEQVFGGLSPAGLLGFGWNHPIAHAAGTAVAVVLGARAIAGEVENGTLELVLAQPIGRTAYLMANLLFALASLALMCGAGLVATLVGARVFAVDAPAPAVLAGVAANFLLLLAAIHGITLLASSLAREGGRALGTGFLVAVVSFLVYTVALLWPDAAFLGPVALHSWYVPRDILETGGIATRSLVVLGGVAVACTAAAFRRFTTRDIP